MKVSRLAEETGISAGAVWTIIHEKLDMSKVSARWVQRMLSPFQKDTRRQCCQENLELLTEDLEHFFQCLVTGDETWVYHRDPESKTFLRGKRFSSDEDVKEAVTTWFEEQSKDFFSMGIKSLQLKWAKCIKLLGDYIEKEKIFFCDVVSFLLR
jgi:hypothetical protein